LRFEVWKLWFGFGCGFGCGFEVWVLGFGFEIWGLRFGVWGFGF